MTHNVSFDAIIVGGSYSGLSAAMALGRSLRNVLVIDSGEPCNRQTPHSHNFLTWDGGTPREISSLAREQVERYPTVQFYSGIATSGAQTESGFEITTHTGDTFAAKKLIFATGIKDIMPDTSGFSECWGISIIHCPYCHGYEVRNEKTGILGNGEMIFEFVKMISNWTKDLTVFTNGVSTLTEEQTAKLQEYGIGIVETEIASFEHRGGVIQHIAFKDGSTTAIRALYAKIRLEQHSGIPHALGCELTENGLIKVDAGQKTTVPGVFASGDNSSPMRSIASSVYTGSTAGSWANKELIDEKFA